MFYAEKEPVKKFTISLVDEDHPNLDTEEFIYDLYVESDGKIIVSETSCTDKEVSPETCIFATEYTQFEIVNFNDLKKALSKKKIVVNSEEDEGLIFSLISEEQTFIEIFSEEDIREIFQHNVYYYVKGKTKKMKISEFLEKHMDDMNNLWLSH